MEEISIEVNHISCDDVKGHSTPLNPLLNVALVALVALVSLVSVKRRASYIVTKEQVNVEMGNFSNKSKTPTRRG